VEFYRHNKLKTVFYISHSKIFFSKAKKKKYVFSLHAAIIQIKGGFFYF